MKIEFFYVFLSCAVTGLVPLIVLSFYSVPLR